MSFKSQGANNRCTLTASKWCGGIGLNYRLNLPKLFVQSLGRNRATVAQFLGKEIACSHEQNLGKNWAILELFLGNSSWQIDERQNLCAPPATAQMEVNRLRPVRIARGDFLGWGDKSHCGRMNVRRLLLNPGDLLARKFDKGYARFVARMKRKIKRGDRRLAIYSVLARAECWLAFAVGGAFELSRVCDFHPARAMPLPAGCFRRPLHVAQDLRRAREGRRIQGVFPAQPRYALLVRDRVGDRMGNKIKNGQGTTRSFSDVRLV